MRDTRRACVLGVDNLILMTKLGENIDGNKEESVRQREPAQEEQGENEAAVIGDGDV